MDPLEGALVPEMFKYLLVLAGLSLGVVYTILAIRYKGYACEIPKWVIAICGFYWAFYYLQSILGGILAAHQIWVRSPLFITLIAVLLMGILSLWRLEK